MDDIRTEKTGANNAVQPVRYQIPDSPVTISIFPVGSSLSGYQIIEPEIRTGQERVFKRIREHITHLFRDKTRHKPFSKDFSSEFTREVKEIFPQLNEREIRVFEYYIQRDARGFGLLQPLIEDPSITSIFVNGPGCIVTVRHAQFGLLPTTLQPDGDEINMILHKIANRSVSPVDITRLPPEISLRSGLQVSLTLTDTGSTPSIITIEKPSSSKISTSCPEKEISEPVISTYHLYHDIVEVRITGSPDKPYFYHISIVTLRPEEYRALAAAREDSKQNIGLKSSLDGACGISTSDFSRFICRKFPGIPKSRHHLLYVAFIFSQDVVRWIRVILADPRISRILCTHPGKPVKIWHTSAPSRADTSVIPDRSDINRFADFLIKSSGKEIDPEKTEAELRFKTGERITLTRVRDDQGHYFRIDIRKKDHGEDEPGTITGTRKKRITVHRVSPEPGKPDVRIEELIARIFDQGTDQEHDPAEAAKGEEEAPEILAGFAGKILNPIKAGMKGFSLRGTRRKEKPGRDEAPIPETLQVESVLNVQIEEGIVAEEAYWLFQPHSYAVIVQNRSKDRSYRIIEPELSPRERIILEETHETLRDVLVYDKPVTRGDLFLEYAEVAKVVRTYDPKIHDDRLSVLYYYLRRNLNGYGKIDALMYDELLEDISCNGHDLPVYIHHRYYGSIPTSVMFESEELNRFVLKLSQKADKQVSLTSPLLDASLPNGSRAQITYSDVVSTKGSSFTIRKFRSDPMTPATLLAFGTYSDELLAFIWLALENRQSLIVVGGTASGKTSAMNAFSFFIPHNSKIVSLEDTREIQIPQKNWLPVQTRASNSFSDRGSVDLFDLLKASLRQRPEYIIVGEVRGNEAQTLFQAMNSGHTTLSTLHAGNIEEALNRLTNEPINVPPAMFGALNLMVIQTFHYRGGRMIRRCDAIHEIVLGDGDKVRWNTLYEYEPTNDTFRRVFSKSKTLQTIQYMHNWTEEEIQYHLDLRTAFLARLRNQYSTNPEVLMQMITDVRRLA